MGLGIGCGAGQLLTAVALISPRCLSQTFLPCSLLTVPRVLPLYQRVLELCPGNNRFPLLVTGKELFMELEAGCGKFGALQS